MSELTNEEREQVDRAMAALDLLAEDWLQTEAVDIRESIAEIASRVAGPFKERSFELLQRMVKHAYASGVYDGMQHVKSKTKSEKRYGKTR